MFGEGACVVGCYVARDDLHRSNTGQEDAHVLYFLIACPSKLASHKESLMQMTMSEFHSPIAASINYNEIKTVCLTKHSEPDVLAVWVTSGVTQ
jgi:hypothetical protein